VNFPPRPRAGSSCAGLLGKDSDKVGHDGDENFNDARNPTGGNGSGLSPNGARRARLRRPLSGKAASVSNHGNEVDFHLRESSVPMEPNKPEDHESHDSSSSSGEDACLLS